MSDYTDDVLEGILCQVCGQYLGEGNGYPTSCPDCENEEDEDVKE